MEVTLAKRYPIAADAARAWQVLCDVPAVARCMPGAELTEQIDATHFKGIVKVKVGPVTAQFGGDLEVLALAADTHTLRLRGKGTDKGGSTATLDLTAQLEAAGSNEATLIGTAHVIINGKLVQMASRMIGPVAETVLGQFAQSFSTAAAALPPPTETPTEAPAVAYPAIESAMPTASATPPATPVREVNALAVLWSVLRNWLATLFGRRT